MAVGRFTARLAAVCAGAGALLAFGASPALAAEDTVRVSAAGKFKAGSSAKGIAVEVRKRTEGCVQLQATLTLYLDSLRVDQVRVQVNAGGRWLPVELSAGRGGVATAATTPENPQLCKGKRVTLRYEVAFAADTADGELTVVGEAVSAAGRVVGRDSDSARVTGGSPSTAPPSAAAPVPTVAATEAATSAASTAVEALTDPGGDADSAAATKSSGGSVFLYAGLAMVAVGVVLIVLLVRRFREDRSAPSGGAHPTGFGYSGPGPGRPPVVGRPATPGLYGSPSTQRPTPRRYGTHPDGSPPVSGGSAPSGSPPVPPVPGQRGPAAPASDAHTRFIPRLPD